MIQNCIYAIEKKSFALYNTDMQKILIFGGAFDPPHKEHVEMCKRAMAQLNADRLVIVPTYSPPHKSAGYLDFSTRCELISLAFDYVDFVIDDIENVRKKDNYSACILPLLKEKYGDIVYLIGGDSLEYLPTWYKPEDLVKVCPIAVCARDGYDDIKAVAEKLKKSIGGEYVFVDYMGKDVSSSVIRAKLLLGEKPDEIDGKVYNYICKNGLFDEFKNTVNKLKSYQTEDLFAHSKAVVLTAIGLNSKHHLNLDFRKVFLAALLHDNAKQRPSADGLNIPQDSIGTPVLHQFLGAEKARRDFNVTDEEILSAIRCHTTAKAEMSTLEKLIYTADSLSFDRQYKPIPEMRAIAERNFEEGFYAVLRYTYEKVRSKGGEIYPLTVDAKEYYLGK